MIISLLCSCSAFWYIVLRGGGDFGPRFYLELVALGCWIFLSMLALHLNPLRKHLFLPGLPIFCKKIVTALVPRLCDLPKQHALIP